MTKYAGPTSDQASRFTLREARAVSEATCRAEARRRGTVYPIPPGKVVGIGPSDLHTNPVYGTHYLSAPRETVVPGEYLVEVTPEMEALRAGTEPVDGADVVVIREGTVRTDDTFPEPETMTR